MPELTEIKGVGPVLAKACVDNGYNGVEQIAAAMLHDLVAVPGISQTKAKLVIEAAQDLLNDGSVSAIEVVPKGVGPKSEKAERKKKKDKKKDKKKAKKKKNKKAKNKKKS